MTGIVSYKQMFQPNTRALVKTRTVAGDWLVTTIVVPREFNVHKIWRVRGTKRDSFNIHWSSDGTPFDVRKVHRLELKSGDRLEIDASYYGPKERELLGRIDGEIWTEEKTAEKPSRAAPSIATEADIDALVAKQETADIRPPKHPSEPPPELPPVRDHEKPVKSKAGDDPSEKKRK